jgi:hypothetical protein
LVVHKLPTGTLWVRVLGTAFGTDKRLRAIDALHVCRTHTEVGLAHAVHARGRVGFKYITSLAHASGVGVPAVFAIPPAIFSVFKFGACFSFSFSHFVFLF